MHQACSQTLSSINGGIFALRAHCALLLDYVPREEPPSTPLGTAPAQENCKLPSLHITHIMHKVSGFPNAVDVPCF